MAGPVRARCRRWCASCSGSMTYRGPMTRPTRSRSLCATFRPRGFATPWTDGDEIPAMPKRVRADELLVERQLAENRSRARALIMAGRVRLGDHLIEKAGDQLPPEAELTVIEPARFVSRGGEKLDHALDAFNIDVASLVCADFGASTGGFTDVLLQRGAASVYAIDVGYGQLDYRLRQDARVTVLERMNIRYLESLPEPVDLVVIDVSFISLRLVLPAALRLLKPGGGGVALF